MAHFSSLKNKPREFELKHMLAYIKYFAIMQAIAG